MAPKSAIGKKKKSPYMAFCADKRAEWKAAGKKYAVPEQGKMLGAEWKSLTDADKVKGGYVK